MRPATLPIKTSPRVIGADVAKDNVVFYDPVSSRTLTVTNSPEALRDALAGFADYDLLICEVTGGYELAVLQVALDLNLAAHRADPARVKNFIRSHGGIAKTDAIDARWLVRYGQDRAPSLVRWQLRNADRDALAALVRHRSHLVAQRVATRNRAGAPGVGRLASFLRTELDFLDTQITALDQAIVDIMDSTDGLAADEQLLRTIPGIGPVVARSLLALLPELGSMDRRQAASLAGLAPHPDTSGRNQRGYRTCGGRSELKPILFMAALAAARSHPDLKLFAQRLITAGKPKRLVLNAIARKLVVLANAILRPKQIAHQLT